MIPISIQDLLAVTGGKLTGKPAGDSVSNVVIDSRKCAGGALYVPIRGERFDGHAFIPDAFQNGALLTLSEQPTEYPAILVKSSLDALQAIAKFYRERFPKIPVIGVTGSVGKTSTKEMLYSVLSKKFRVHKNVGNLNNQTGLPQTIFTLDGNFDLSIMELGTNHFGEIHPLAEMAEPDVCLFTNIGVSHIEHFHTREGIFEEKTSMLQSARPGYRVVVNGDDDLLSRLPGALTFGLGAHNAVRADGIEDLGLGGVRFTAHLGGEARTMTIHTPGMHLVYNALAALATGSLFEMSLDEMQAGVEAYRPEHGRMDVMKTKNLTIIDDSYNSVLASALSALSALSDATGRRVAILGDILELGDEAESIHRQVGACAGEHRIELVLCIGGYANVVGAAAEESGAGKVVCFDTRDALEAALPEWIEAGDTVLVKGSRGLSLEHTVEKLKQL